MVVFLDPPPWQQFFRVISSYVVLTSNVVPHSLCPQLHGKRVLGLHKMSAKNINQTKIYGQPCVFFMGSKNIYSRVGVSTNVATTANVSTD